MESDHDILIEIRRDLRYVNERFANGFKRIENLETETKAIAVDYVGKKSLYKWALGLGSFAAAMPSIWHFIKGTWNNVS